MPELPEVETIRRSLMLRLIGAEITRARLLRRDIAVGPGDPPGGFSRQRPAPPQGNGKSATPNGATPSTPVPPTAPSRLRPADLLQGERVAALDRRGKRLLIRAESGRALGVHLGMTGQLLFLPARQPLPDHTHAVWWLAAAVGESAPKIGRGSGSRGTGVDSSPRDGGGTQGARLVFRDPRRFGGLWLFPDPAAADVWLDQLGPDALTVTARQLAGILSAARRPVKAALLDQALLAGVGNIYADEALYTARVRPDRVAAGLEPAEVADLARAIRTILRGAIARRGSTLRDYRDPDGQPGRSQGAHLVYGRAGAACLGCERPLISMQIAQRTTVLCPNCQR